MCFYKKFSYLFSSLFLILFFSGCIHQINKEGLIVSLTQEELSQSFNESFPLKKDFIFGTIAIDNPTINILKDSQRVHAGINLDFQTMFTQKIAGNFIISGEPIFDKESASIFLQNVKIEEFKFMKLRLGNSFSETFLDSLNPMMNQVFEKYPIYIIPKESFQGNFVKDIKIEDSLLLITYGI